MSTITPITHAPKIREVIEVARGKAMLNGLNGMFITDVKREECGITTLQLIDYCINAGYRAIMVRDPFTCELGYLILW